MDKTFNVDLAICYPDRHWDMVNLEVVIEDNEDYGIDEYMVLEHAIDQWTEDNPWDDHEAIGMINYEEEINTDDWADDDDDDDWDWEE